MFEEKITPNPHETQAKQLDKQKRLAEIVSGIEDYQVLKQLWTPDEVASYLKQIAKNTAEGTIQDIQSQTPAGFAVDFHERFEMKRLVELVDEHWGEGTFRSKLAEGRLNEVNHYFKDVGNRERRIEPYMYAHTEAMRAEVAFLQKIAEKLGYKVSLLALLLAKPNIWKMSEGTQHSIESFYSNFRSENIVFGSSEEHEDYPLILPEGLQADILIAERFFREFGDEAKYVVLPSDVIKRNGFYRSTGEELSGTTQVVQATNDDIDTVWNLIKEDSDWLLRKKGLDHWSSYYTREIVEKKIQTHEVFILRDGTSAVGSITLDQNPVEYYSESEVSSFEDSTAPAIYVSALAVRPEFHGRGIASSLLQFAEQEAQKRGIKYVRFDCRAEYEDLVRFYEKRGYTKVGSFSEGEGQNYLLMEKKMTEK